MLKAFGHLLALSLVSLSMLTACSTQPAASRVVPTRTAETTGASTSQRPFCPSPSAVERTRSITTRSITTRSITTRSITTHRQSSGTTPQQFRDAYGVTSLLKEGYTGKGQTVVVIDSFGSPTVQEDMNLFDQAYGLPPITLQILSPLGTAPYDPRNVDMGMWAGETSLDVQVIHAIAPGAAIDVLTSPVDEVEGTTGLPQFLQLEEYAVNHHLGTIVSQSWGVSEETLGDQAGQQEMAQWAKFYQNATLHHGITFFTGSGDNGASDYVNCAATVLSTTPTTSFPADEPWVTSVGATTLLQQGGSYSESAWSGSGGGFSMFTKEPDFQLSLPRPDQVELNGRRGVPDVAVEGDPNTGWPIFTGGQQASLAGGTSAGSPFWAALLAIADQMAGHPLGTINPELYELGTSAHAPSDFHDITQGDNTVDNAGPNDATVVRGYWALPGWDPITGLGTPNAAQLIPDLVAAAGA